MFTSILFVFLIFWPVLCLIVTCWLSTKQKNDNNYNYIVTVSAVITFVCSTIMVGSFWDSVRKEQEKIYRGLPISCLEEGIAYEIKYINFDNGPKGLS